MIFLCWLLSETQIYSVDVKGIKELQRWLRDLESKVIKKHTRAALRVGCKVFQAEARSLAPDVSGLTRKAIKIASSRGGPGKIAMKVTIDKKAFPGFPYGIVVDQGFKHGSRKLGDARKVIPGKHFMTKAYDAKKEIAADVACDSLSKLIQQETK